MSTDNRIDVTLKGLVNGYEVHVHTTARLTDLPALTERMRAAGIEPMQRPAAAARPAHVEPVTNASGEPCCPHHARPLKGPNQWGKLYCTARDEAGQYCKFTVKA